MGGWAGIALALRGPDEDAMASRLPTVLHPISGRALGWHALRAMALAEPAPQRLFLPTIGPHVDALVSGLPADPLVLESASAWWPAVDELLDSSVDRVLVLDAAAATVRGALDELVAGPTGVALRSPRGRLLAAWLDRDAVAAATCDGRSLRALAACCRESRIAPGEQGIVVRSRRELARAARVIRDRTLRRLMDEGATFVLPESVVVDIDVTIGHDTVVYPGVVLEGETRIGAEAVIGPGCRIIDSRIGDGAELKGWNYIVRANIRNRAVLEPYVRRGFD